MSVAISGVSKPATILLVDDDSLVLTTTTLLLQALGYTVVGASDGAQAVEHFESAASIDLMMTDVLLPDGFDGRSLAQRLQSRRPGTPVLLVSGEPVSNDEMIRLGLGNCIFLQKPFGLEILRNVITRQLNAR